MGAGATKWTVSVLFAVGIILIAASGVALEWVRPRTIALEVPTLIGLFGPVMAIEELVSLAVSIVTPVMLVAGVRFRGAGLLPLLPAIGVGAILAWRLSLHGAVPLALWVVNLSSCATVIGLAAISSSVCAWLAMRHRPETRTAS